MNNVIGEFEEIILKLDKLIKNKNIFKEDIELLTEQKNIYNLLIDKYYNEIENFKFKNNKIKIMNDCLGKLGQKLQKTKTDNTKAIENYENTIETFEDNIVSLYMQSQKEREYNPNIEKEVIPIEYNNVGIYRFIHK